MRKKIIGFGFVLMLCFAFGLSACAEDETHEKGIARIESISRIQLPKEIEVEYHYYYRAFQGDLLQYTVFKLNEESAQFLLNNSFSDSTGQIIELYISLTDIPQEFHPEWESNYLSLKFSVYDRLNGGTMLFFSDTLRLIVVIRN